MRIRRTPYLYRTLRTATLVVLVYTLACLMIPFEPGMPGPSLDPSWRYAINEAVARHFVFGKDLIFTFGPYGSLYTQMYHPATDTRMLAGSAYLAVCFIGLLVWLTRRINVVWRLLLIVLFAGAMYLTDALFFAYPLMVALLAYRLVTPHLDDADRPAATRGSVVPVILLFSPLGLIPLVKGSMLPLCVAVSALSFLYALIHRRRGIAVISILSPLISMVLLWTGAGQPLQALPGYFWNMVPIISGYTEAMIFPAPGGTNEKYVYVASTLVILVALFTAGRLPLLARLYLALVFALYLFLGFKAGFVRHDGHALIALTGALLAAILARTVVGGILIPVATVIAIGGVVIGIKAYIGPPVQHTYWRMAEVYRSGPTGVRLRLKDPERLERHFERALGVLRAEGNIPLMQGTTDVYPFDQAYLLATRNQWAPRPVLQSYSAYTESLEELDAQHVAGDGAPDNIAIRIFSLDGRYPSLDDGPSWPIFFARYEFVSRSGLFSYLRKKTTFEPPVYTGLTDLTAAQGQWVDVPKADMVYVKVQIQNTLKGKVIAQLYRPSPLRIRVRLEDGTARDYRLVSRMGAAGFVLSPLVESGEDFENVYRAPAALAGKRVTAMQVVAEYGESQWDDRYTVKFYAVNP
ncbi:hypothetical protein CAL12_26925 [Bordetella genomosp. 8]|uniref:Glycosyltransferase RgtA/B/C/D-like domain-containing protein n=1 Tax=Bordetella genomosp. 8 TaxID=1416806 RepID=A0A1W6YSK6_9BORD|nr:hypothetical protein [Bordetella genomosp. 8]ARP84090.1 hypothetical protein CAL12_26925 [Bordetella genomosp. 8]